MTLVQHMIEKINKYVDLFIKDHEAPMHGGPDIYAGGRVCNELCELLLTAGIPKRQRPKARERLIEILKKSPPAYIDAKKFGELIESISPPSEAS